MNTFDAININTALDNVAATITSGYSGYGDGNGDGYIWSSFVPTYSVFSGIFTLIERCSYCDEPELKCLSLLDIFICESCFKKVIDRVLCKNLNTTLIETLKKYGNQ